MIAIVHAIRAMDPMMTSVYLVTISIYTITCAILTVLPINIVSPQLGRANLNVQLELLLWIVKEDVIIHVLVKLINIIKNAMIFNNNPHIVI